MNFTFTLAAFNLGSASRVLADKLAFWLGALGFVAFPIAVGFLANSFADGFGDLGEKKNKNFHNYFFLNKFKGK